MKNSLLVVLVFAALGCATKLERDPRQDYLANVPQCATDNQCRAMWIAARKWIERNTDVALDRDTDVLMQTSQSSKSSRFPAVSVSKDQVGNSGIYRISVETSCNLLLGCEPGPEEAEQSFNLTIGPLKPGYPRLPAE